MTGSPTILIVEDHTQIRRMVRMMLGIYPLRVIEAANGLEALAAHNRYRPELVFLDLMLPDAEGADLCRKMKTVHPETRVVILSARGQPADRQRAHDGGADGYVVKPFEETELYAQVEQAFPGIARRS